MSPDSKLNQFTNPPESPAQEELLDSQSLQDQINATGVVIDLVTPGMETVSAAGEQLKAEGEHHLRNQLTCWILTDSEALNYRPKTSIDSNGLKVEVAAPRYDAHLPFRLVPLSLIQNLETSGVVSRSDLLEIRSQRARFFGEVDDEAEQEQLQLLATALKIEEEVDLERAITDLIIEKEWRLKDLLTKTNPKLHLPVGFVVKFVQGTERDFPSAMQGIRTAQWFEFIEDMARTHIGDPSRQAIESKRGKRLDMPGIENLHTLRQSAQAWDKAIFTPEYYAIAQMTNAGLREGVFEENTCLVRADVDPPESHNHREILGIYHENGYRANILLCPGRHLENDTTVQSRFAKIPKPLQEQFDLSKTPLQDLEVWFRPYQRFNKLMRGALIRLEKLKIQDGDKREGIQLRVLVLLTRMREILQMHVPDFRVETDFPFQKGVELGDVDQIIVAIGKAKTCYKSVLSAAISTANTHLPDSVDYVTTLAEKLAGAPLRRTITFDDSFIEGLQHDGARFDPELSRCGVTTQVVETNALSDREVGKIMGSLRMEKRDVILAVCGSMDFEDPKQQAFHQQKLRAVYEVLSSIEPEDKGGWIDPPPYIFTNENQAGAGIAAGWVSADLLKKIAAEDPKGKHPKRYARFIGIAPGGVVEYPGNRRLIHRKKDGKGWWAIPPMDIIALNSNTGYKGSLRDAHAIGKEYDNQEEAEALLTTKISKGHRRIGFFADGGPATVSKLVKFCRTPGPVIIYGGLGRFGALANQLLQNSSIPLKKELFGDPVKIPLPEEEKEPALQKLYTMLQATAVPMLFHEGQEFYGETVCKDLGMNLDSGELIPGFVDLTTLQENAETDQGSQEENEIAKNKYKKMRNYLSDFLEFIQIYYSSVSTRFYFPNTPQELAQDLELIRGYIPNTLYEEPPLLLDE